METTLTLWLGARPELDGINVSMDVPPERPDKFVTVERTGGGASTHGLVDRPTLAIQCWAGSRVEASDLAETVADLLRESPSIPQVKRCTINSISNFPLDETTPRYQIVADMVTQTA